ncbi:hypothetical protein [Pseudarthrobacter sp. S9]|uniref:hypothetical protein n=1 Tax=Pseudarthrobacter sp. S9 TaxID=3418421 RepID=UPI003CFCA7B8
MNADRPSLEAAFAPASGRGSGLQGLLPPKRSKVQDLQPEVRKVSDPRQPAVETASSDKPAGDKTKASDTVPGAARNIGVYLPPELLKRVKASVRERDTTYTDLLVEAFDTIADSTISARFSPVAVSAGSGMPRRMRRIRGSAGIQIQLRLDDRQVEWLDEKVVSLRAPSRSGLVSAVFDLYLQGSAG